MSVTSHTSPALRPPYPPPVHLALPYSVNGSFVVTAFKALQDISFVPSLWSRLGLRDFSSDRGWRGAGSAARAPGAILDFWVGVESKCKGEGRGVQEGRKKGCREGEGDTKTARLLGWLAARPHRLPIDVNDCKFNKRVERASPSSSFTSRSVCRNPFLPRHTTAAANLLLPFP